MAEPVFPEMMECIPQKMRLTVAGCARLWVSAHERRPMAWEGRHKCIGCPVGAKNAGHSQKEAAQDRATEVLRLICPRCAKQASRLINGDLCVSHYNRVRELSRGKNAKGNPPVVVQARLHAVTLMVAEGWPSNAPPTAQTIDPVTSTMEAIIRCAKAADGPVTFGRVRFEVSA